MKEFIVSSIDEFNTSEAYYSNPIIEDEYITIPYINMGLMEEHPLNHNNQQIFIDFCFLQILYPKYISIYDKGVIKNELKKYDPNQSRWYGGSFVGGNSVFDGEIEVQASDVYLIIPESYRTSLKMWMPNIERFAGKGNINKNEVLEFFSRAKKIAKMK